MKLSTRNLKVIILILLLIIIALLLFRCCRCCKKPRLPKSYHHGIVFWRKPDSSQASFHAWVDSLLFVIRGKGEVSDSAYCTTCDSSLVAYAGVGTEVYLSQTGSGGSGGSGGGNPVGGNSPGYYCANIDINNPYTPSPLGDSLHEPRDSAYIVPQIKPRTPVIVGVFDTGDSLMAVNNSYFGKIARSCLPDPRSLSGWNFVDHYYNTEDDHKNQHGTKVAQFIINQASQYQAATDRFPTNRVEILPVKIFNHKGAASLFDLLCGISYAANGGVKIINASFGFYKYADTPNNQYAAEVMQKYLEYYLVKDNILMVAAAGNRDTAEDVQFRMAVGNPLANPRDLDINPFYPASLVKDTPLARNILVVTTVGADPGSAVLKPSPLQNFSRSNVDAGVVCDAIIDSAGMSYFCFWSPLPNPPGAGPGYIIPTVTGSSFATPIVTGKIAAYYDMLTSGQPIDKEKIINKMETIHPFTSSSKTLLTRGNNNLGGAVRNAVAGVKKEK